MEDLLAAGLNTVVSALLGGLAGYGFAAYQSRQQTAAKRRTLLHFLVDELQRILIDPEDYDPSTTDVLYPINIESLGRLLDGETLDPRSDAPLVLKLLNLKLILSRYNDFVQVNNLHQTRSGFVGTTVHKQLHALGTMYVQALLRERDGVLLHLRTAGIKAVEIKQVDPPPTDPPSQ